METTNGYRGDAIYVLGRSEIERRRLIEQDAFLGGFTGRLFREAGIGEGMRVLDVGCGVGDVSLLAASLVGPKGTVVGVDTDLQAVATSSWAGNRLRTCSEGGPSETQNDDARGVRDGRRNGRREETR